MLTLTVPTYRRPESLYRLLASLGGCEYRDSLEGFFVFDDEEGPNNTAAAVSRVNKEFGLSVQYVGFAEKQLLKEELSAGNRELSDALEFAFWGMEVCGHIRADGMNRNAILLRLPGKRIISADDDILFHYLAYKKSERFLEKICARRVYQNIQGSPFFAFSEHDWEEFQKHLVPYTGNPFGEFERVLGASAQQLGYAAYPLEGPIRIAMSGVYGGRWYSSAFAVADANPLQQKMWKNQAEYDEAKTNPHALLLIPAINIRTDPFLVAAHIGYDGRDLLPPFLPHIRNDDGIWAFMVRAMYPESPICQFPFAISHDRDIHRPLPPLSDLHAAMTANGLMRLLIALFQANMQAGTPEEYLVSMGMALTDAAGLPEATWRELTMELYLEMQGSQIAHLEQKLEQIRRRSCSQ
jgi:hypothetical protein